MPSMALGTKETGEHTKKIFFAWNFYANWEDRGEYNNHTKTHHTNWAEERKKWV